MATVRAPARAAGASTAAPCAPEVCTTSWPGRQAPVSASPATSGPSTSSGTATQHQVGAGGDLVGRQQRHAGQQPGGAVDASRGSRRWRRRCGGRRRPGPRPGRCRPGRCRSGRRSASGRAAVRSWAIQSSSGVPVAVRVNPRVREPLCDLRRPGRPGRVSRLAAPPAVRRALRCGAWPWGGGRRGRPPRTGRAASTPAARRRPPTSAPRCTPRRCSPGRSARCCDRVDAALGRPDPLDLVDVGAGRGELLAARGGRGPAVPGPAAAARGRGRAARSARASPWSATWPSCRR